MSANLDPAHADFVRQQTQAKQIIHSEVLQELWSGYGQIMRLTLHGGAYRRIIIKHITLPDKKQHPRGWNTQHSHQRKIKSYRIESHWYQHYAQESTPDCRLPLCLGTHQQDNEQIILLEDLDSAGYSQRRQRLSPEQLAPCLCWLAHFHARFLGQTPTGLWPTGSYWHLDTRPDELSAMADGPLKKAAQALDQKLKEAPFPTLIHGDAKIANFCFSPDLQQVAALDFQYVGLGCAMKDLAYFLGSCLSEKQQAESEPQQLDRYFGFLQSALAKHQPQIDARAVEAAWRPLYPVAATDFLRFLLGWMPDHPKITKHSRQLAQQALAYLPSS